MLDNCLAMQSVYWQLSIEEVHAEACAHLAGLANRSTSSCCQSITSCMCSELIDVTCMIDAHGNHKKTRKKKPRKTPQNKESPEGKTRKKKTRKKRAKQKRQGKEDQGKARVLERRVLERKRKLNANASVLGTLRFRTLSWRADWTLSRVYRGLFGADQDQFLRTSQGGRAEIAPKGPFFRPIGAFRAKPPFAKPPFGFPRRKSNPTLYPQGNIGGGQTCNN